MKMLKLKSIKTVILISLLLIGVIFIFKIRSFKNQDLSNGFGELYNWNTLSDALIISQTNQTPIMVIIFKNDCPACKVFKSRFSNSNIALKLSKYFVMVNINGEEVYNKKLAPDGDYYPRILFLDFDGKVNEEIYNMGGNIDYKYFYYNINPVVDSMNKAVLFYNSNNQLSDL